MRIFTTILFTALVICGGTSFAQIAAWDFTGENTANATSTAEVFNANMDASADLTRGAGAAANAASNSFRTTGFKNNGISVDSNDYFQITLSAAAGYELSLSTIDADFKGTGTFAAAPGVSNQFAYSTNGTTFTLIGTPQLLVGGTVSLTQIDLSGITALQDLPAGTTVTLRFYASGQTTTGGWGFFSAAADDYGLAIGGSVDPVGTPCVTLTAPVAPAVSICNGSTATLSATASETGSTLTWYNAATAGTVLGTGTTYSTTALSTTTSFWVDETVTGCPASPRTEVVVTVNTLPTVGAGSDMTVCTGANVTLNGSGAVSYVWNNGVTNGAAFVATATTTYMVTGTDANGCTDTDDVIVTVSGTAPTANAGADQQVCAGTSVSLTASGTGTFSWSNGVQQATPFVPTTTTTYTVTVDNGVCTNTDQVTVTVFQPSVAGTIAISDVDACLGDLITGTLTGYTGTSVEWFIQAPGFPVYQSVGTTATLSATAPLVGSYNVKVQVTNGVCPMVTSSIIAVVVNALPTVNAGTDQTVCAGTAVTLAGAGAATYVWNNSVTNNTAFTPTATATYTVTGTDSHGCTDEDVVTVTVTPLPTVSAGPDVALCAGESVTLNGSGATTYSWNNSVIDGVNFTPTATATYTVTGTTTGCTNTDQVVVTVNALPVAAATLTNNTLTATPAGQTYQWINCTTSQPVSGATSATFTPTVNGTYSVEVTNTATGCSATSSCVVVNLVGLEENNADAEITLFPNPTKGKVTLAMSGNNHANVTVYNALGKVVSTINHAQNGTVIDLSASQSGVYMIQVAGEKGSSIYRIVKN